MQMSLPKDRRRNEDGTRATNPMKEPKSAKDMTADKMQWSMVETEAMNHAQNDYLPRQVDNTLPLRYIPSPSRNRSIEHLYFGRILFFFFDKYFGCKFWYYCSWTSDVVFVRSQSNFCCCSFLALNFDSPPITIAIC